MEDISRALRELAESNYELIQKLDEVKQEIVRDREEKKRKAETRARNSLEMDIKFVQAWKYCDRGLAIEKLQTHQYDVGRVVGGLTGRYLTDGWKHRVLLHYEHKKNRRVIERW